LEFNVLLGKLCRIEDKKDLLIACEILASYCKEDRVKVEVIKDGKKMMDIELEKKDKENFRKFLITKSESFLLSIEGLKR
jgi:hypothetical protein